MTPRKKALITGLTRHDRSYPAGLLLSKSLEVHGLIRRASAFNAGYIDPVGIYPHEPGEGDAIIEKKFIKKMAERRLKIPGETT